MRSHNRYKNCIIMDNMKCKRQDGISRQPLLFVSFSFLITYLIVGILLRMVLLATSPADASYTFGEVVRSFAVGVLSDLGMGIMLCAPMAVVAQGSTSGNIAGLGRSS